jgi:undecaprenyl-diphosphatase
MDILQSVAMGVVEGFSEFLPISSTGHMIVLSSWMGLPQDSMLKAFEVIVQLASILAVTANYADKFTLSKLDLWKKIFIAFLPLAIVGFILRHEIKELFSVTVVAWAFIAGGVVFIVVEHFYDETSSPRTTNVEDVTIKQALVVGIAQIASLIPGTSRSGSTIIGGLLCGLDRKSSAEFSFLLAFPVMLAVSGYDLVSHYDEFAGNDMGILAVGFVTSFVVAYLTIRLFISFLRRFTFVSFGIYRIIFGTFLLFLYT